MLFATLDPTTRRVQLPKKKGQKNDASSPNNLSDLGTAAAVTEDVPLDVVDVVDVGQRGGQSKGQEVLLTDTVGFISKLPTDLIAAFR